MWPSRFDRRRFLAASAFLALGGRTLYAQGPTERDIPPVNLPEDRPGIWTLHFRYKVPRIITVRGPNGQPQEIWYMWFQVYNRTGDPQTFLPEFELVAHNPDVNLLDEPRPYAVDAVRKIENPNREDKRLPQLWVHTTIDIAKRPIEPTKEDSFPNTVTGAAIWTDMAKQAPKTNKFSIFISGLSDGLTQGKLPSGETLIKRKTLQLDFLRPTDESRAAITDIRLDPGVATPENWIYRPSSRLKQ